MVKYQKVKMVRTLIQNTLPRPGKLKFYNYTDHWTRYEWT